MKQYTEKTRKIWISILVIIIFLWPGSEILAQTGRITVELSGIAEMRGQMMIGLYDKPGDFPHKEKAYQGVSLMVREDPVTHTFSGLPQGEYAIAVFHDTNENKTLDRNLLGIPTEGYAFSNNASALFGAPEFQKAKFRLEGSHTAKIKMKY